MKRLVALALLAGQASAGVTTTYVVPATMGAVVENHSAPCGADTRKWLEAFVGGLQVVVTGKREHIAIVSAGTTRLPDTEVPGDPLIGFWRQSQKTIGVVLQGDIVHPRVDISFIFRDSDGTCYEKWEGLAVQQ